MTQSTSWNDYSANLLRYNDLGFSLDTSRVGLTAAYVEELAPLISHAFAGMAALEAGSIANPDEGRMVGHYWLRNSALSPDAEIKDEIDSERAHAKEFAAAVHSGAISAPAGKYTDVLIIGIGGSALGPQLVADALNPVAPALRPWFLDNTDPDGIKRVLSAIGDRLKTTLAVVISKSGGTKETRNGMLEAKHGFEAAGLDFARQAVAVTGRGSQLDQFAESNGWVDRFNMTDWVGGRTSVMSTVGLVPCGLMGVDMDEFLAGAAAMDEKTRVADVNTNAAMRLALAWHKAGDGKGKKDMVILPYKDRLVLLSKYLQQLVMESLGKTLDLDGNEVHQGIAVYGNKGSTDQHAYVQQLRDGVNNFFATFLEVREAGDTQDFVVEPERDIRSADYLQGFLRGTRKALTDSGRLNVTISLTRVDAFTLGLVIALFERAVGYYALLVNINAYHQPGVEAGKKAAENFLTLLVRVRDSVTAPVTADDVASLIEADPEDVFHCLTHLAASGVVSCEPGETPAGDRFSPVASPAL